MGAALLRRASEFVGAARQSGAEIPAVALHAFGQDLEVLTREELGERKQEYDQEDEIDLGKLDPTQQEAVRAAIDGKSLFITGGAGTGKTRTVLAIVQELRRKYGPSAFEEKVAITGATGTAGILAGGCTLHSATGLRVPKLAGDFKRVGRGIYKEIWSSHIEVLLLDEASMISGEFLDRLEKEVRRIRENDLPFGGIQVILVGDIFQLPPIGETLPPEVACNLIPGELQKGRAVVPTPKNRSTHEYHLNRGMIFQSDAFWDLDMEIIELKIPHRQSEDQNLANILAMLRLGPDKKAIVELNRRCYDPLNPPKDKGAEEEEDSVFLLSTIKQVNEVNTRRLSEIVSKSHIFQASDRWEALQEVPENTTFDEELKLLQQREDLLKRSSFFEEDNSACPAAKKLELKVGAFVMLTWTLDSKQGLVNGLIGRVLSCPCTSTGRVLVQFRDLERPVYIERHGFKSQIPGIGTCFRNQYPLRLAWAITHHRSQGKTLPSVVVDPRSFTHGQTYVALSRSPSLAGLSLTAPANSADFRVNPASLRFRELLLEEATRERIRKEVGHWQRSINIEGLAAASPTRTPKGPPGPDELMSFGRFKGRTFQYAAQTSWYADWALRQQDPGGGLKRFVQYLKANDKRSFRR